MKPFSTAILILLAASFFFACSSDDDTCSQTDWVGIYTISTDSLCDFDTMSTLIFNQTIEIAAGASETTIDWDGDDVTFTDCETTDGIVTLNLDGNKITSTIGDCEAMYTRN